MPTCFPDVQQPHIEGYSVADGMLPQIASVLPLNGPLNEEPLRGSNVPLHPPACSSRTDLIAWPLRRFLQSQTNRLPAISWARASRAMPQSVSAVPELLPYIFLRG